MKIHGFICQWKGQEENAIALQRAMEPFIDVTVISTEESIREKHPHWIHLDQGAYFSQQWNQARDLFSGDIFFQMQSDARFDDFERLFQKVATVFSTGRVGVYEPNINFTAHQYEIGRLQSFDNNLYEIPMTDTICWFIGADILFQLPPIDLSINTLGWGVCAAIAALCHINNKVCVRDYSFTVIHPEGSGYSNKKAMAEKLKYFESLDPAIRREITSIHKKQWRMNRKMVP